MTITTLRTAPWGVLVVVVGNLLLDTVEVSSLFVLLPQLTSDLGLNTGETALVAAAFPFGFVTGIALANRVVKQFSARAILVGALLAFAVATLLSARAGGVSMLALARLAKGISAGLTAPLGNQVLAAAFADPAARERATKLYSLVGGGGFVAGLLLTAPLLTVSWRVAACWPAPVALILAGLAARWMRSGGLAEPVRSAPRTTPCRAHAVTMTTAAGIAIPLLPLPPVIRVGGGLLGFLAAALAACAPLRAVLQGPAVRTFATNAFTAGLFNGAFLLFFAAAQQQVQSTPRGALAALATAPVGLGMALAIPLTGTLTRRVPLRVLVSASATCAGVAYLVTAALAPPSVLAVAGLSTLVGVAFVLGFVPLNLRAVADVPTELRTIALGSYQMLVQVGAALALPLSVAGIALAETNHTVWPAAPVFTAVGSALFVAAAAAIVSTERGGTR